MRGERGSAVQFTEVIRGPVLNGVDSGRKHAKRSFVFATQQFAVVLVERLDVPGGLVTPEPGTIASTVTASSVD